MLQQDFVPVAIDQWYQRRQKDAEGDYWRKIAAQGPRKDFAQTTQGHYICDANGTLLGYNGNHIDLARIRSFMKKGLDDFDSAACANVAAIERGKSDPKFDFRPPADGLVVRVYSKILGGYEDSNQAWKSAMQRSVGQDNLWIRKDEISELINGVRDIGVVPKELAYRIARFHLTDNTRGEPPRWTYKEVKSLEMSWRDGTLTGSARLATGDQKRTFDVEFFGKIEFDGEAITRFDLVAEGQFKGEGYYTTGAPKGKFPLVVVFRMADPNSAESRAIPHGGKGWIDDYYNASEQ